MAMHTIIIINNFDNMNTSIVRMLHKNYQIAFLSILSNSDNYCSVDTFTANRNCYIRAYPVAFVVQWLYWSVMVLWTLLQAKQKMRYFNNRTLQSDTILNKKLNVSFFVPMGVVITILIKVQFTDNYGIKIFDITYLLQGVIIITTLDFYLLYILLWLFYKHPIQFLYY